MLSHLEPVLDITKVCEGDTLHVDCGPDRVIRDISAKVIDVWPVRSPLDLKCVDGDDDVIGEYPATTCEEPALGYVGSVVYGKCNGKPSCQLAMTSSLVDRNGRCFGANRFVEVSYECRDARLEECC